jgi:hypothetical protein
MVGSAKLIKGHFLELAKYWKLHLVSMKTLPALQSPSPMTSIAVNVAMEFFVPSTTGT